VLLMGEPTPEDIVYHHVTEGPTARYDHATRTLTITLTETQIWRAGIANEVAEVIRRMRPVIGDPGVEVPPSAPKRATADLLGQLALVSNRYRAAAEVNDAGDVLLYAPWNPTAPAKLDGELAAQLLRGKHFGALDLVVGKLVMEVPVP
jgi:hypothetical protein